MPISRREMLQSTAALPAAMAAAGALPACSALTGDTSGTAIPIVDTHQHLWDLNRFQPPWLKGAPKILSRSYTTREYVEATKNIVLAKAVYMEVDVAVSDQAAEAMHVFALSKSVEHPTAAAVISGRPDSEGFNAYVNAFKDVPYFKGVRQVLHPDSAPRRLCLRPRFVKSVRHLGSIGRSFDLCMRPTELSDGVRLAKAAPDTRLIVDHCGNADPKAFMNNAPAKPWHEADPWKRDIEALAAQPNVVCKISGIVARAPKDGWDAGMLAPIVDHCLDTFGPERVVFGSDWPVCLLRASLEQWVHALQDVIASRPIDQQRKLFGENAVRLYGLA